MSKKNDRKFLFSFKVTAFYMILVILLLIPVLAYLKNFINSELSSSPADWGAFGDYFGGILNPIIGVASIVILGYISIKLGEDSTSEQRELFFQERRTLAYQELNEKYVEFHKSWDNIELLNKQVKKLMILDPASGLIEDLRNEIQTSLLNLNVFYVYFLNFGMKYRNIFSYDFSSNKHLGIINTLEYIVKQRNGIEQITQETKDKLKGEIVTFNESMFEFLSTLSSELDYFED